MAICIIMKPTNSPTQGQPNPRKNRLRVAFRPFFPTTSNFLGVGIGFIQETDYNKPNPTKLSANTLIMIIYCKVVLQGLVIPGAGMKLLQNWHNFRARLTERTHVSGRYSKVIPVPVPAPEYFYKVIPEPRVLCHRHTYVAYRSSGYGYECRKKLAYQLAELLCTGNTPGMLL